MADPDALAALLALPRFGTGVGLHRVQHAVAALDGAWWRGLDAIKITGSNGKGSTSAMVAAILRALGLRVGLYTSPHLRRFNERIDLCGVPIADAPLEHSAAWALSRVEAYERGHPGDLFGAFEAWTAMALHAFARAAVDVVVAEAGIGGRHDATRVIPGQTCGLVSIDREHTALLGPTEEAIALDKADLCPIGGELVVGPLDAGLHRRLQAHARSRSIRLHGPRDVVRRVVGRPSLAGTRVQLGVEGLDLGTLSIRAPGEHQIDNAVVAVMLVQRWLRRHRPGLAPARRVRAVTEALAGLQLPGRIEQIHEDPPVVIDVGHTPAAVTRTARTLASRLGAARVLLVTGVSADREAEPILTPLVGLAHRIIATQAHHRGAEVARIAAILGRLAPDRPCESAPTPADAMRRALAYARAEGMTVVVGGGLFLAMEAAAAMRGEDPRDLRFP